MVHNHIIEILVLGNIRIGITKSKQTIRTVNLLCGQIFYFSNLETSYILSDYEHGGKFYLDYNEAISK